MVTDRIGPAFATKIYETIFKRIAEHKRLFGFQPSRSTTQKAKSKRSAKKRKPNNSWRKDCICLKDSQQCNKPSPEEKMELSRIRLGLAELMFDPDGNADHIRSTNFRY